MARTNCLAQDRVDIAYSVEELSRRMSCPTDSDWIDLKRLGRYLLDRPRVINDFNFQRFPSRVDVFCDSDWAGCARTRRSTSEGALYLGDHLVKTWSVTQATIALSSAEAEYNAAVKAASAALGFQSLLADLGVKVQLHCHTDSSAAIGI